MRRGLTLFWTSEMDTIDAAGLQAASDACSGGFSLLDQIWACGIRASGHRKLKTTVERLFRWVGLTSNKLMCLRIRSIVSCHTTPSSEFASRSAGYLGQVKHTFNRASFASRFQACYDEPIKNEAFPVAVIEVFRYRSFYPEFGQSQANLVSTVAI